MGHLDNWVPAAVTFAQLQTAIDQDRPLCAYVEWQGGGGHFVVLSGYRVSGTDQYVTVEDPNSGQSMYDFQVFLTGYETIGTCTGTYNTQP